MKLPRENYTLSKYNTLIRTISIILIVVFLWQNLVWANPDLTAQPIKLSSNNIQVQTIFSDPANQDCTVAYLIMRAVENSVPDKEKLTISDIDSFLSILDKWDEKYLGTFEWETSFDAIGIANAIIISIKDDQGNTQAKLRYYDQSFNEESNKTFSFDWAESKVDPVNPQLYRQVKEFDENGELKDDLSTVSDESSQWGEKEIEMVAQILEFSGETITDKLGEKFILKVESNETGSYPILIKILRKTDRISVGSVKLNITSNSYSGLTLDLGLCSIYSDVEGANYQSRGILKNILKMLARVMPTDSQLHIGRLEETDTLKDLAGGMSWVKTKMGKLLFQSGWKPEVISICKDNKATYVLYDRGGMWKHLRDKDAFKYTLAAAIKDIDKTDQIKGAVVRVELSRIKKNRKSSTKKDSKRAQQSSGQEKGLSVYAQQSIQKDRYETVVEHMMNLFVLMARRMHAKEQKNKLFIEPLKFLRRREAVATGFHKVVELIEKNNEPAASAFLVGKLNAIAKAQELFIRKKIASRRTKIKVWRQDGKILMQHHVYIKQQEASRSAVPEELPLGFDLRWQAGSSIDHQGDSILKERDLILEGIKSLERANERGPEYLAKAAGAILAKMSRVDVKEKRLARLALDAVKKSIDIGYTAYVKHILPIAIRYLKLRVENLDSMLENLKPGRIEPLCRLVNEDNDGLIKRTNGIKEYMQQKNYKRALGNSYGLWKKIKSYLDEPDMEGLSSMVWPMISAFRKIKELDSSDGNNEAKIEALSKNAEFWLDLVRRKLSISKGLSLFVGEFRGEYVKRRLNEGPSRDIKGDTFIDVYDSFVTKSALVRGSPEEKGFKMLCYLAAFVPFEVEDPAKPSQKRANPIFDPINKLRIMVEVDDINKILAIKKFENLKETKRFLSASRARETFSNLDKRERTLLLKALTADFDLSDSDRFEIAKALAINKTNLRKTYKEEKRKSRPNAMLAWLWDPFIVGFGLTEANAARFSFLLEELLFGSLLITGATCVLTLLGLSYWPSLLVSYVFSNIYYGITHERIYRWEKTKIIDLTFDGGIQYHRDHGRVVDRGKVTMLDKAKFTAKGAIFRAGYLVPAIGPAGSLLIAMVLHGFYNNYICWHSSSALGNISSDTDNANRKVRKRIVPKVRKSGHRTGIITVRYGFFVGIAIMLSAAIGVAIRLSLHVTVIPSIILGGILTFAGARRLEKHKLDYYLNHGCDILNNIRDAKTPEEEEIERKKLRGLFKKAANVYKSYFIRDLVEKRKMLLVHLVAINVLAPEDENVGKAEGKAIGSVIRSEESRRVLIHNIFIARDKTVSQHALEALIEEIAKYPDYWYKRFYPLIENSGRLPRFAKALIKVLVDAEHKKIKLFDISGEKEFFRETKNIIKRIAVENQDLKKQIIAHLLKVAERSKEEIPLVRKLLDDLGFHVVKPTEFAPTCARELAGKIINLQQGKGPQESVNIVFATGDSMIAILRRLALKGGIDWSRIHAFHLGEYDGLSIGDPQSFAYYLNRNLFNKIPPERRIPKENIHYINGADADPTYLLKLQRLGGADIVILGIGQNGHIAFNEPGSSFTSEGGSLRKVDLSKKTIEANKKNYPGIINNPRAYTMGLADILKAKHIFLFAKGPKKAKVLKKALFGSTKERIPASILQLHNDVTVVLDKEAMKLMGPQGLANGGNGLKKILTNSMLKSVIILLGAGWYYFTSESASSEMIASMSVLLGMVIQNPYNSDELAEFEEDSAEIISRIENEIKELDEGLDSATNIQQVSDVSANISLALEECQQILSNQGNNFNSGDPEMCEILLIYEQDLRDLKTKANKIIESDGWNLGNSITVISKGAEEAEKNLKSGKKGKKFLEKVSAKLESLFHLREYIKERHPEIYKRDLKRMEEARNTLEGVIASLKGSKEGSSLITNALMIASVVGLLVTVYVPIVAKYMNGLGFTMSDMLFVYVGFVVGALTVATLTGYEHFKVHKQMVAEKSQPIKGVKRVLILDDRQGYIDQLKKIYPHALEAKTVEDACKIIENNPTFDLVISDLCLHENAVLAVFKKVQINGKKVTLRRSGQEFVLWLKNHKKAPEHIVLHSTMFNLASFDAFFSFITGYNPIKTRKIVEAAGITVQPKSWMLEDHRHSRKTILMWMGIVGVIFFYDMSVILEYLASYVSILAASVFSAIVTGLGIKAIIAGRQEKESRDYKNSPLEEKRDKEEKVKADHALDTLDDAEETVDNVKVQKEVSKTLDSKQDAIQRITSLVLEGETSKAIGFFLGKEALGGLKENLDIPSEIFNLLLDDFSQKRGDNAATKDFLRRVKESMIPLSGNIEVSHSVQLMAYQALTVISWIERDLTGAERIRVTSNPEKMAQNDKRGQSFLDATTLPVDEVKEEGALGFYWRGIETILTKLKGDNISSKLVFDKDMFDNMKVNVIMYLMNHGFIKVPDAIKGLTEEGKISTIHETSFINDMVPGTYQTTSTGSGHFQENKVDIKHVTEGRGVQLNVLYDAQGEIVEILAQEIEAGDWALALPGYVDYMVNWGGLRFNDFSVALSAQQAARFNPKFNFSDENIEKVKTIVAEKGSTAPYVASNKDGDISMLRNIDSAPGITWVQPSGSVPFDGSLIDMYQALTEEKLNELVGEAGFAKYYQIYPSLESKDDVIENITKIIPLFVRALRAWESRVDKDEEVVLFLDMPEEQGDKIKKMIEEFIIKPLQRGSGENANIKDVLSRVRVVSRGRNSRGLEVLKRRVLETKKWNAKNIVIMTNDSNLSDFDELDGSFITALDFSLLNIPKGFDFEKYYYPYVEATFFALIRALGARELEEGGSIEQYKERMWNWYKQIPNIEKLTRKEFVESVFDDKNRPKHTVILKLIIPDAVKFDPRDAYKVIKEFITKA